MASKQLSDDTEQLEKDVQMAIKNIKWAKKAGSAGDTQKANNHLHRAQELLEPYAEA